MAKPKSKSLERVAEQALAEQRDVWFPSKLRFLFSPARYKVAHGGRGSAKSWGFARALLLLGTSKPLRVLCARELQNSITESVHRLLSDQIENLGLQAYYTVQQNAIYGTNGTEFIFSGIRNNVTKIKSMEGIDICWVEEAEKVSDYSWQVLIPTLRKAGSEIWVTFNPDEESDPTSKRFILNKPPDAVVVELNWRDNPWFPDELRKEMEYLFRVDPDAAEHVWNGKFRKASAAQIFRGKYIVESFEPVTDSEFDDKNWQGPYYGADWGFANDPTTLVKCWVYGRKLYIEHESYGIGVENDDIAPKWRDDVPGVDDGHTIRADCSRPETISHVAKKGRLRVVGAEKWQGSVEDGVRFLRSFEVIVIHPRCKHMQDEARFYKYKVDKLTGDILPEIEDKHNHLWDAVRYALQPAIKHKKSIYDNL